MQNFGPRCKYSGIPHTLLFCKVFVFNILRVQPRFIRIALYLAALLRMHDIARCSVACESRSPIKLYDLPIQKLPLMDTGPSDADSRTEATESKYLMHFQRSLVEVFQSRDDYRNLFSEEEQQIAIPFLNLDIQKQLSRAARGLFTRLFQRKGPWFRVENIISYEELLVRYDETVSTRERRERAQRALDELEQCGYLTGIRPNDPSCDESALLEGIETCFRADELRPLLKRFCRRTSSGLSRQDAVNELKRGIRGQRTLGAFFSPSGISRPGESNANFVLIRLEDRPIRLFRRVLRLLLHVANGGQGGAVSIREPIFNPGLLQDFGKIKFPEYECIVSRPVFPSRRRFLQWEAVQELRYALDTGTAAQDSRIQLQCLEKRRQECKESVNHNLQQVPRQQTLLVEPVIISDQDENESHSLNSRPKKLKRECMHTFQQTSSRNESAAPERPSLSCEGKTSEAIVISDSDDCIGPAVSVTCRTDGEGVVAVNQRWILRSDLVQDLFSVFLIEVSNTLKATLRSDSTGKSQAAQADFDKSRKELVEAEKILYDSSGGDRTILNTEQAAALEAGLLAAMCLTKYLRETGGETVALLIEANNIETAHIQDTFSAAGQMVQPDESQHLLQLDPGWGLSSIIWHGVDPLERSRRYFESIKHLRLVLSSPYLGSSRGAMYNRLALDLQVIREHCTLWNLLTANGYSFVQHCGDDARAVEACNLGLLDRRVGGGDLLTLQKRRDRLVIKKDRRQCSFDLLVTSTSCPDPQLSKPGKVSLRDTPGTGKQVSCDLAGGTFGMDGAQCRGGRILEENIRGVRLGERAVGRKSRFAGYDPPANTKVVASETDPLVGARDSTTSDVDTVVPPAVASMDGGLCSVETLALQHYARAESGRWHGIHCEGSCLTSLFGILMWDVLFASVPDVFLTPFQDAPLDLCTPSRFYSSRIKLIDSTLSRLAAAEPRELAELVAESWMARRGVLCRGVQWDSWTLSGLQLAACCVGGRGLAAIFRALCENYRHLSGGLPDLLLMRISTRQRKSTDNTGLISTSPAGNAVQLSNQIIGYHKEAWSALDISSMVEGMRPIRDVHFEDAMDPKRGGRRRGLTKRQRGNGERQTEEEVAALLASPDPLVSSSSTSLVSIVADGTASDDSKRADGEGLLLDVPLCLDWDKNEYDFQCRLVEVKGPGDRLMDRQTFWLQRLSQEGLDVCVCRVNEGSDVDENSKTSSGDHHQCQGVTVKLHHLGVDADLHELVPNARGKKGRVTEACEGLDEDTWEAVGSARTGGSCKRTGRVRLSLHTSTGIRKTSLAICSPSRLSGESIEPPRAACRKKSGEKQLAPKLTNKDLLATKGLSGVESEQHLALEKTVAGCDLNLPPAAAASVSPSGLESAVLESSIGMPLKSSSWNITSDQYDATKKLPPCDRNLTFKPWTCNTGANKRRRKSRLHAGHAAWSNFTSESESG